MAGHCQTSAANSSVRIAWVAFRAWGRPPHLRNRRFDTEDDPAEALRRAWLSRVKSPARPTWRQQNACRRTDRQDVACGSLDSAAHRPSVQPPTVAILRNRESPHCERRHFADATRSLVDQRAIRAAVDPGETTQVPKIHYKTRGLRFGENGWAKVIPRSRRGLAFR